MDLPKKKQGSTHSIDKNFPIPISDIGLLTWFLYQNIENVVLTEVPTLMVDASELVLTPI